MKRNGIIFVATLIAIMFAGQVIGQDKFIVTATSPDASGGSISGGTPFSIQINMDNDSDPATDFCGGGISFEFYSPDGSIDEITHVDVGGPDPLYGSIEYINGFEDMMNMLIIVLDGTDLNGNLPDSIGFTTAGLTCMPAAAELTAYIKFNIQIDYSTSGTEGTFCIDSISDGIDDNINGPKDWDWLFLPEFRPPTFNGPYCWTITNLTYTDVQQIDQDDILPNEFSLEQNYPNPFNPSTSFNFALPRLSQVKIDIFNVLGQKIKTLADAEYPAGRYTVDWDGTDDTGSDVASGIYFYRMNAGDFQDTKKLMLLK